MFFFTGQGSSAGLHVLNKYCFDHKKKKFKYSEKKYKYIMFVKNDKCSNIESKYINLQDAGSCCLSLESIKI